jgi:hypothetical protein
MARKRTELDETESMTVEALVCRQQGHAIESIVTALPSKLKGASAVVDLYCKRYNPAKPSVPIMCGYHVQMEVSLADGGLISRAGRYPEDGYLRHKDFKGMPRLTRDEVRGSLFARLIPNA